MEVVCPIALVKEKRVMQDVKNRNETPAVVSTRRK
jgi:hypothetical protein